MPFRALFMGEGDLIAPCAGSDRDGGLPGLSDAAYFLTFSELPFGVDGRAAWVLDRPAIAGIRREPRLHSKTSQTYPVMIGRVVACVTQNRVSTASPSGPRPMAGPVGSGPLAGPPAASFRRANAARLYISATGFRLR